MSRWASRLRPPTFLVLLVGVARPAAAFAAADVAQLERDIDTATAEVARLERQYPDVPALFTAADREDRATWGSIYHLNREFERASLALFGAVEPREGETEASVARSPNHGESLYLLADSLFQLGNVGAARQYFERLLALPGHGYRDDAIQRLMEIAAAAGQFDDVDRYFNRYLQSAGSRVPGKVRYLRARSLFLARRDDEALEQLGQVPAGEAFDQRARYLRAAIATRKGELEKALALFDEIVALKPVAREDAAVRELAHLGRGRVLYELDRLDESVNAYQAIDYDSPYLTTMLYEVTLTFVRRGQLALRGSKSDGLTEAQRREKARVEYQQALRQLDDLRALDPDGERAADIELLAANLRLQRFEFAQAEELFRDVSTRYRAVDDALRGLITDTAVADRILADILALEKDPRAPLQSPLPLVAAQRAARMRDVAQSVAAFKELADSRQDVADTRAMLDRLDEQLSPENPARAELFKALQSVVDRSTALSATVTALRARALAAERTAARPGTADNATLDALAARRAELEAQVAQLPQTPEELVARKQKLRERADAIDRSIHELQLASGRLQATATSVQWLAKQAVTPEKQAELQGRARDIAQELAAQAARLAELDGQSRKLRASIRTAGGKGSGEEMLRNALDQAFADERTALVRARGTGGEFARLDVVHGRLDDLARRNDAFRQRLDAGVEQRLAGTRAMLAAERRSLDQYDASLATLEAKASGMRGSATAAALTHVREEIADVVLRADVGLIDSAFTRKQAETEKISSLRKARAAALTDLTQAYADLTKDESP